VIAALPLSPDLHPEVLARALNARDVRFDGLFFVGITTTGIYCRPVCPARVSVFSRRRFFASAAAAEYSGFRPCLRCRPELAPGRALVDAVPRLAQAAAQRIAAGALNGRTVASLARELGVSERHLRRALEREVGASPLDLAQTHRLLLAKRLLADTALPITQIAYASGFQSLRRFNAVFQTQYRMPPSALRRSSGMSRGAAVSSEHALLRLTLAYRPPLAWDAMLASLRRDAIDGVEVVADRAYSRLVNVHGKLGVVRVHDAVAAAPGSALRSRKERGTAQLTVDVSPALVPVLMPLLARLRHLLDLDAEPSVIDAHLSAAGLGTLVARCPGLRVPSVMDGFEAALRVLLGRRAGDIVRALGEPVDSGVPALDRALPDAARVLTAGASALESCGVSTLRAAALLHVARMLDDGSLRLEPGCSVTAAHRTLAAIPGVGERLAVAIVTRALAWPDAFDPADRALQRATGTRSPRELAARAESWRPWRAYAAQHLATGFGRQRRLDGNRV
jgi:AraC family transcriptional regulator, regulatory protein of adaptative response / DNA-3-methyladenine glycosylase II